MKKKSLSALAKGFTTFCLLFYSFAPTVLAIDETVSQDNSQDILATGISDPSWIVNGDTATTADVVLLNQKYTAPQDSNVSVTFTKLPSLTSKLTITKILLTDEEVAVTRASSNVAYDISTDMNDGTFAYDLTLPNTESDSKVVYAESRTDLVSNAKEVDNTIIDNGNTLKIENLDHFTIYIVQTAGNTPTVSSGTVNGASSVTVLPGASITVKLKVTIDNNESWKSTSYQIGNNTWTCADTDNQSGNGTYDGSFTITAPNTDGTYSLNLIAYSRSSCNNYGGTKSETYTMTNAIVVDSNIPNVTNPTLTQSCGLDIALVIDNSSSIDSSELAQMKSAMISFVDSLEGTPTQFSVTKFGTNATVVQSFTSNFDTVRSAINGISVGISQGTNWKEGISTAAGTFDPRTSKPNLMIFASDGNPTYPYGEGYQTTQADVDAAKVEANTAKSAGIRILALGIGDGLDTDNLEAISGNVLNGTNLLTTDVITTNFSTMAGQLASFTSQTCGGTISVNKYIDTVSDSSRGGANWTYTVSGNSTVNLVTDTNGQANTGKIATGTYSIVETNMQSGYRYGSMVCKNQSGTTVGSTITNGVGNITVGNDDVISCDVLNLLTCHAGQHTLEGQIKGNGYTTGSLSGWSEGDNVPARLTITGLDVGVPYSVIIEHDYQDSGITGYENFNSPTSMNSSATSISLSAPTVVSCGSSTTCKQYTLSFTPSSSTVQLDWKAQLSEIAAQWSGASLHYRLITGACGGSGNKDIPLNPKQLTILGTITPIKSTANGANPNDWKFNITGNTNVSNVTSGTTAEDLQLSTNNGDAVYTITEVGSSDWILDSVSGDCTKTSSTTATVTLTKDKPDITCTFVNKINTGHIIIDKVTLPSGSTQSFDFTTTGSGYNNFSLTDSATPNDQILNPGTYSVSETALTGWDKTSATCSDGSPISAISLSAGETVTCTFVNTQRGTIFGYKLNDADGNYSTTNDRTGVAGWTIELWQNDTLKASTTTANDGSYSFYNVQPGAYQLKEAVQAGWYKIYPTGSTLTVNLNPGQSSTDNNFVNVKYPSIKVIKNVDTNGDGTIDQYNATDWQWNINNTGNYQTGNTVSTLTPNTYTISEVHKANYHVTNVTCNNGMTYTPSESISATLTSGQDLICTFTNTRDTGTLKIVKVVTNNNGGNKQANDFAFQIDTESPIQFNTNGIYEVTRYAGLTYNISETNHDGYSVSYDNCSNVLVSKDSVSTCTITNDDIAPSLTLVKSVTNDNGGNANASDWTVAATGPTTISGQGTVSSNSTFSAGTYTLSESNGPEGYQAGAWSCTGIQNTGNQITLGLGQRATCTIVNNDIAPSITLYKHVTKDNGGVAGENDFGLTIGSTSVTSGQKLAVTANTPIALNETGLTGYNFVSITGDNCPTQLGGTVTLNPGQNISCTINNDDVAPSLALIKTVVNNNGGNAVASDWTLTAQGETTISGNGTISSDSTFKAGTYTLSESNGPEGYSNSGWNCIGVQNTGNQITLKVGERAICTIVNTDVAPTITLNKHVTNNNGGIARDNDFGLTIGSTSVTSGQKLAVNSNTPIALNETGLTGYSFVSITGEGCPTQLGGTVTLQPGQNITCTINNDDMAPSLALTKYVTNDNNGVASASDWTVTATGPTTISGQGTVSSNSTFSAGTYTLSESNNISGYVAGTWSCTGVQNTGNQITLGLGQSATCSIINNDVAPSLTLVKSVINDNGGRANASDWTVTATGPSTISGQGTVSSDSSFLAGTYTLSESNGISGYTAGNWNCIGVQNTGNQITLKVGERAICTIVNDDIAPTITLYKIVNNNFGGSAVANDFDLRIGSTYVKSGVTLPVNANTPIIISEAGLEGYTFTSMTGEGCPSGLGSTVTLNPGQNITCTINNTDLPGTITINKHVVDGENVDEGVFSNTIFGIILNADLAHKQYISDTSEGSTSAVFTNLSAGTYTLTEDRIAGFKQLGCYVPNEGEFPINREIGTPNTFTLHNGENLEIVCDNQIIDPVLNIAKTNDTAGIDRYAGDNVTYTITVTAPSEDNGGDYVVKGAKVSDILPNGFQYVTGTWKAVSSIRGDLVTAGITTEPVYGTTPAVWLLGDITEGEVITLTYTAQISSLQDPGLYKDIAWTYGKSLTDNTVLGNATSGVFVGTQVNVVAPVEEGDVLGITDYVGLPNTGANTTFTIAAIASFMLGALLLILGSKKKMKYVGVMLISVLGLLTFTKATYAQTADTIVHIEQPSTPTNQTSFKIGYVAADLLGRDLQIQCYETTKGAFGPVYTSNNGDCLVDSSIITADGTYEFYVTVTADSSTVTSDKVTVVVDNTTPSPVTGYTKTASGCSNILQFTVANDGQTNQIQIFRSDKATFTANSSNLIATISVTPNQVVSYTDSTATCGVTYYYAIRAVDNADNVSSFVTDKTVVIVPIPANNTNTNTSTTSSTTTEEVKGSETSTSDTSTNTDTSSTTSSVTDEQVKGASSEVTQASAWDWIKYVLIVVGVIGIMSVAYIYVNKRVNKKNSK